MTEEILLTRLQDNVLTLTLNRPKSRNALSPALMRALLDNLSDAAEDARVRCIVLRGNGKDFCAGGDIAAAKDANENRELSEQELAAAAERAAKRGPISAELMTRWLRRNSQVVELLYSMPKPTVAILKGNVVGAGIGLALACDFRVVDESARLSSGFIKVGYSGDFGSAYFLTKLLGSARAREVLLLNRHLSGRQLADYGLATEFVSDKDADTIADSLARELAQSAPIAMGYMKQNLRTAEEADLRSYLDLEAINQNRSGSTQDSKEAIKAFFEKRTPVFQGK